MKTLFLIISICSCYFDIQSIDISVLTNENLKEEILIHWVKAHNSGNETEIKKFIFKYYQKEWLTDQNISKHIHFYMTVFKDFGKIESEVFRVVEESDTKLRVLFLKKGVSMYKNEIPETDILSVEIDVDLKKGKLERGLGLAPLICARLDK